MFFVDKRHCSEFGIITSSLWIKGTGLSLVLFLFFFVGNKRCSLDWYCYVFFVDKRHYSEFGIITCFLRKNGTVMSLVLLRLFCG